MASNDDIAPLPIFYDAIIQAKWAKQKIDQLDSYFTTYVKGGIHITFIDGDVLGAPKEFVAKADSFNFPTALVIGEIVRNLRASLDYAVSAIVLEITKDESKVESAYFPISDSIEGLQTSFTKRAEKLGLGGLRAFFLDEIKPVRTENFPLWGLNQIDRQHKHRSLPVVEEIIFAALPNGFGPTSGIRDNAIQLYPGSEINIPFPRYGIFEQKDNFNPSLRIQFGNTPAFAGQHVVPTLAQLFYAVMETLKKLQIAYVAAYS